MKRCLGLLVAVAIVIPLSSYTLHGQTFSQFPMPGPDASIYITAGPDGNMWITVNNGKILRLTVGGSFTVFPIPTANSVPQDIAAGPDGNIWFTERQGNKIGRITPAGVFTEFPLPTADSRPVGIAAGPDGNIWFTENLASKIGRITPQGMITEFPLPVTPFRGPEGITAGPDGNIWFTEVQGERIGRITPEGVITEFPGAQGGPRGITAGPDGNVWYTLGVSNATTDVGRILVQSPNTITQFSAPTTFTLPVDITLGSDDHLYLCQGNKKIIGRVDPEDPPVIAEIPLPTSFNNKPFGIASGPDGNIWFAAGDSIGRLNISTVPPTDTPTRTPTPTITPSPTPTLPNDCCIAHGGIGCHLSTCADCVCQLDPRRSCCDGAWTAECVNLAAQCAQFLPEQSGCSMCQLIATPTPMPTATRTFTQAGSATPTSTSMSIATATGTPENTPITTATPTALSPTPSQPNTPMASATATPTAPAPTAPLAAAVGPTDTLIPVADVSAFPESGVVRIGLELIRYNGKRTSAGGGVEVPGELLNAERGFDGTTPSPHAPGSLVVLVAPFVCVGDCDGGNEATVDEILRGISIALGGAPLSACPVFDCNQGGQVTVDCIIQAVNNALTGCPG